MLDPYKFGEQLIKSNDLDPVYVLANEASMPMPKLTNWLLAYWCFYHVGTASWIVDQSSYWTAMEAAAASKTYPRSSERRHYRGQAAIKSVAWLKSVGVDALFEFLIGADSSLSEVTDYVQTWAGFGPWISFKVADMVERLGLAQIRFKPDDVFDMYDSPAQGAAEMYRRYGKNEEADNEPIPTWAYRKLMDRLGKLKAPPRYERTVNIQEIETVLCKWHSHVGGHYHVGEDIAACRAGLLKFARCRTAQALLKAGKAGGLWQ